jgi:aspartyl aminopeptidase
LCNDPNIRLISLFDNEEIGSTTAHGADSILLESTLRRLCASKIGSAANTEVFILLYKNFYYVYYNF